MRSRMLALSLFLTSAVLWMWPRWVAADEESEREKIERRAEAAVYEQSVQKPGRVAVPVPLVPMVQQAERFAISEPVSSLRAPFVPPEERKIQEQEIENEVK